MSTFKENASNRKRPAPQVNWEKVSATTEGDIQRHTAEDGGATADFGPGGYFLVTPQYVRGLRKKLDLTREAFAASFGLSERTIEEWELGRQSPTGPARALLRVIEREPEAVKRALMHRPEAA
jgi:putative transcriptional regulator